MNADYPLIPYLKGNKWGYANASRQIVLNCIYDMPGTPLPVTHANQLICIKQNNLLGFINIKGETVIEPQFENVTVTDSYPSDLIPVQKNGKWGYINTTGQTVIDFKYSRAELFSEGLGCCELKGKMGAVDTTGKLVIPHQYKYTFRFQQGVAEVKVKRGNALINTNNEVLTTEEIKYFGLMHPMGFMAANNAQKKYGIYNTKGEVVVPFEYTEIGDIYPNGWVHVKTKSGAGLITLGEPVPDKLKFPSPYSYIGPLCDGRIKVRQNDYNGYTDEQGNEVIPPVYRYSSDFKDGFADFSNGYKDAPLRDDGTVAPFTACWGYINKQGHEVIMMEYERTEAFYNGLALVNIEESYGYINTEGKRVTPIKYARAANFKDGFAKVGLSAELRFYIDTEGNEFYEPEENN